MSPRAGTGGFFISVVRRPSQPACPFLPWSPRRGGGRWQGVRHAQSPRRAEARRTDTTGARPRRRHGMTKAVVVCLSLTNRYKHVPPTGCPERLNFLRRPGTNCPAGDCSGDRPPSPSPARGRPSRGATDGEDVGCASFCLVFRTQLLKGPPVGPLATSRPGFRLRSIRAAAAAKWRMDRGNARRARRGKDWFGGQPIARFLR